MRTCSSDFTASFQRYQYDDCFTRSSNGGEELSENGMVEGCGTLEVRTPPSLLGAGPHYELGIGMDWMERLLRQHMGSSSASRTAVLFRPWYYPGQLQSALAGECNLSFRGQTVRCSCSPRGKPDIIVQNEVTSPVSCQCLVSATNGLRDNLNAWLSR